jgi:glycosyltransferase involved in cell wall biosynthesis
MRFLGAKSKARVTSLVWRTLTAYGRVKYRYLLPLYGLAGKMPNHKRATGTHRHSRTLIRAASLVAKINGGGPGLFDEQLKTVIRRVENAEGAVIFPPTVGWDIINPQRSHHLATEFARQGYVSIFDCSNAYDDVNGFRELERNLFLFRGPEELLAQVPEPLLWTFTYNYDRTRAYSPDAKTIYDWMDDLDVFPYDRAFLERNHRTGLRDATIVVASARRLYEDAVAVRPDALYLPNGVEFDRFYSANKTTMTERRVQLPWRDGKPVAGYYGVLADWFDYDLVSSVAQQRPDWNFLLIGPKYDNSLSERGQEMLRRPNVRWIGARKYDTMPHYLKEFDVAIIPFVINDITLATSPMKLFEYFAGGKPVLATPMPECMAFPETFVGASVREFSNALDEARRRGADPQFSRRMLRIARENSWAVRAQMVVERVRNGSTVECSSGSLAAVLH